MSKITTEHGTCIAVELDRDFELCAKLVIELPKGRKSLAYIPMSVVRKVANSILGYDSPSLTEINATFEQYALNATWFRFAEYDTYYAPIPKTIAQGWTLI